MPSATMMLSWIPQVLKRRGQIKGFIEDVKSNERPKPLLFIGLIVLAMITSLQNIVISLDIYGIKIFDKDDQAANIKIKEQCFAAWSSLSKI